MIGLLAALNLLLPEAGTGLPARLETNMCSCCAKKDLIVFVEKVFEEQHTIAKAAQETAIQSHATCLQWQHHHRLCTPF